MTKTGGRSATVRHIAGESALSVGMPNAVPPPGWRWVALTSVARLESGHTPSRRHPEYWGGDIPWLSIRDAKANHGGVVGETIETTNEIGIENSSARVLPKGTICLSRTASVGYVTIIGRAMATSQDFVNWVCSDKLDPRFLQYLLIFEKPSLARFSSGAVHQTIYFPEVKAFHVCIPAIEEQRRIVEALDQAFAAIAIATANAEKNLANVQELFENSTSILLNDSEWPTCSLGEICAITSKLVDPRLPDFIDLPHVGAGNMEPRTGEISGVMTAREENLISGKFLFDASAVLYSKIRPYLMKVCRPNFAGLCSADVYPLTTIADKIDRDFLYHVLMSREFTAYAEAGSARSGMPKVNRDHLFAYQIRLPAVEIQREIAGRIDALADSCARLASVQDSKLAELLRLKQSLLYRAFSGELASKAAAAAALNDNFATPEFAAKIVAFAYERHVARNRVRNFGTVKAEKILHMVEAIGGIDLGRQPLREAAGPDDAKHRHATWDWARSQNFFRFNKRSSGGHDFEKLSSYSGLIEDAKKAIVGSPVEKAIELLVDMDRDFAELIATTYAAWNNLIIDQCAATDGDIVLAARDKWHRDKLRFDPSRFHDALRFIRNNSIVPDGTAKRVGGQEALLF